MYVQMYVQRMYDITFNLGATMLDFRVYLFDQS